MRNACDSGSGQLELGFKMQELRVEIPKLTLVQWAHKNGLLLTDAVDAHIHAGLRSARTTKTYRRWYMSELARLQDLRDKTVDMYRAAVDRGEVINPDANRVERLMKTASGHPDNPSVQAARRIIERMGYGNPGTQFLPSSEKESA